MSTTKFLDGNTYSRILVAMVKHELELQQVWPATHADISRALGASNNVSRQMVSSVCSGSRSFGKRVFEEYAKRKEMSLRNLLSKLVEWEQNHRSLGIDANQPLFERIFPNLEERKCKLKDSLRRRFMVDRDKGSPPQNQLAGTTDSAFRDILVGLVELVELAFPGSTKNASLLFLFNPSRSGGQESRCLDYAPDPFSKNNGFCFRSLHEHDEMSSLVQSGRSAWKSLEEGSESLKPIWVKTPINAAQPSDLSVCFSLCAPCYRSSLQLLPRCSSVHVRVSLHLTIELDNDVSDRERTFIASVVAAFAELVEYVCLGTVGDVLSAAYTADATLDAAEVLVSSWTAPPIERAEAAVAEWINSLRPKKKITFVSQIFRKLLAADVWLFDRWSGSFYFRPQLELHGTMSRAKEIYVTDTETGRDVSYENFYKRHIAKLCPRPQEGKSIECIGKSTYMVVHSNPEAKELLRAEVAELLVGTKIGVPLVIHSTPNLVGVAWLRFECNLPKSEIDAILDSVLQSLSSKRKFGGFLMSPRFSLPAKVNRAPQSKRQRKTPG